MYRIAHISTIFVLIVILAIALCWIGVSVSASRSATAAASQNSLDFSNAVVASPQFVANITAIARRSNALVYHSQTNKIYASIPSGADSIGNSIAKIDPTTGMIEQSVWVGSEPNKLALANDGNTLYVSLDGARAVRKVDLATLSAGQQFQAGFTSSDGPLRVLDIAVSPNNNNVVAVSRGAEATSSSKGVAIFENGIQRANVGGTSAYLAFSDSESVLFGNAYNGGNLERLSVDASGVAAVTSTSASINYSDLFVDGSTLYTSSGRVFGVATGNLLGTFPVSDAYTTVRPFVIDSANNKAFYVARTFAGLKIQSFDTQTFVLLGTLDFPGIGDDPTGVVRWGTNGLAISTDDGPTYFIQSDLVGTGSIPTTTQTPTPTPTPTSPIFVRRINIPTNDIIYSQSEGKIYMSIPGAAGAEIGNTITRLSPETGAVMSSVFIGSEPNKLAISNDGSTLYASLAGANAIRRFDTATQTAGLQFTPANSNYPTRDIVVLPANPQTVVVSSGDGGAAVYDNGVKRPNAPNIWAGPIEHNGTSNVIYAYNDVSTGFNLYKLGVNASGLSVLSSVQNLIYRFNIDMLYDSGRLYCDDGRVVDPETSRILGTFDVTGSYVGSYSVAVDSDLGRAFVLKSSSIEIFDTNTFNKVGTISYPFEVNSTTASSLIRWGSNGLAFRTGESHIYLIQSPLVSPNGTLPIGYNMESAAESVSEGNSSVSIDVVRTGDLSGTTSVSYATSDGTATAGTDYTQVKGTLTFNPGEVSKSIIVPITNDNVYEGNETFGVTLSNPTGNNSTITYPNSSLVTITDNEFPPFISGAPVTVPEPLIGQTTVAQVAVDLTHPSVETITLNYSSVDGTAQAGSDYVAVSGSLTFNPLEISKIISVTVLGDNILEGDETFSLNLVPTSSTSGGVLYPPPTITILDYVPDTPAPFDFDGDGKTDVGIYRAGGGEWWWTRSSDGVVPAVQFGLSTDVIAPGDFTGDGKLDHAFFRPSDGFWNVLRSEDFTYYAFPFGTAGDVPVTGDYDGDGKADAAVFRPSGSTWFIARSSDGGTTITGFGAAGDVPVTADYDGDGKDDIAIYRPNGATGGEWWINRSTAGLLAMQFGSATDKTVPGDYTGDGKADVAFWRPSTGEWYILRSEDSSFYAFPFGQNGDIPAPGDYDGDGQMDAAVFRNGIWYIAGSTSGTQIVGFGVTGDKPIPNSFVR